MKKHQSPYAESIARATGARGDDLPKIEAIMREEIFHSTLDWQSEAQLAEASAQAYELLRANRALYEMHFSHVKTLFEESRAEAREKEAALKLENAAASGNASRFEKCRAAHKKAVERLEWARRKGQIAANFLERISRPQVAC